MLSDSCVFHQIVKGAISAQIVYEDDLVLAFLDIEPISLGHTLIIPKESTRDLYDLDEVTAGRILKVAGKIGQALKRAFGFDGISIMENNDVFQDVPYFHLHVYGRNKDKDIKVEYPEVPEKPLETTLSLLKKCL